MLKAYFDESGTHAGSPALVIAGYVASAEVWSEVEKQWREVLKPYKELGLVTFHMSEAVAQKKQFAGIERLTIKSILAALANVIKASKLQSIYMGVEARAYDAATTPDFREIFPKPYDYCFHSVMQFLDAWSRLDAAGTPISMIFAVQDEYNDRTQEALAAWKRYGILPTLGPIAFDYPSRCIALQPADMLAHELANAWGGRVLDPEPDYKLKISPLLKAMSRSPSMGGFSSEEALRIRVASPASEWVTAPLVFPKRPRPS